MINTTCDASCGKEFVISQFRNEELGGGIEHTFFSCPHCQKVYTAFYTDEEIRELQAKQRKVREKIGLPRYDQQAVQKQLVKLQNQIKAKMDELRRRLEGVKEDEQSNND